MKAIFTGGSKDSYKERKEDGFSGRVAVESDPLLTRGTHPSQRGTIRSRRMSKSPETTKIGSLSEPILSSHDEESLTSFQGTGNYSHQDDEPAEDILQMSRRSPEPDEQPYVYQSMSSPINEDEDEGEEAGENDSSRVSNYGQDSTTLGSKKTVDSDVPPPFIPPQNLEDSRSIGTASRPALMEIPEEIYAVRKAALQVLKPLTKTWVIISVGFSLTVLFGMARWTRLLPGLPFWFILFPSWACHGGLVFLHIQAAQALSAFIADANESRQRPDSRDHLNRTEYLPLLQRSLKFGLKTGILSFAMFLFEILMYIRLAKNTLPMTVVFIPLWLMVLGGLVDGLICKTQHGVRVICWMLTFAAMILLVLKLDYGFDTLRWRMIVSPVILVLCIASASLGYIVYGHQVGYYQLTESQLTAGNLYSLAALLCIVLIVMIGEVIPLSRPVEIETRMFVVILAPLVVSLVGMGAWVVSRDEFGRLLLYGGQAAVHPMLLRFEASGWNSVQGKGVTMMPMFGEVSFRPLQRNAGHEQVVEMCMCCSGNCYPYEIEEGQRHLENDIGYHPYLETSRGSRNTYGMFR